MRIGHISDLHVFRVTYHPRQFLSKQWLGNLNLLVNRRKHFLPNPPDHLIKFLVDQKLDHLIISGDLSSLSLESEFASAAQLVDAIEAAGTQVHVVPGNHDNYTKDAFKKGLFYNYFGTKELQEHRVTTHTINDRWTWIGLDCTIAAGLIRSNGRFCPVIEDKLKKTLATVEGNVILTNHFPLSTTHPTHDMEGVRRLIKVLKASPNVKLYLHGHIHRHKIDDRRRENLPLVLNAGSCGQTKRGSCHILTLDNDQLDIDVYNLSDDKWLLSRCEQFQL